MGLGYRFAAIGILGRQVIQPRGLVGVGTDSIDFSGREIHQIFEVLAEKENYPLLIHCAHGKDRTGLMVMLVLLLLGVAEDAISQDYMLSQDELKADREDRRREMSEIGLTEDFLGCPPDWVGQMRKYLDDNYGGPKKYLAAIGVAEETQRAIKSILRDQAT
ncbi:MAG: hypothetical protein M1833_003257 [Piccolia ochrophora]|nr:MAG: hypothetical protein M1833_003257 [Piccolia ochrophora]